ncbi:MAG: hypothetical protein LC792_29280 [Actinobacteria bacterium]|nr:hypothetical protein [Actinomycetota bacterium]
MTRQAPCGPAEADRKARLARAYLDLAEQTALGDSDEARNVAAGNAVLAAIAASDALTCHHLGRHSRGQAHQDAAALLRSLKPDGAKLAKDLHTALGVKDSAHYGSVFIASSALKSVLRATVRLVEAAERAVQSMAPTVSPPGVGAPARRRPSETMLPLRRTQR